MSSLPAFIGKYRVLRELGRGASSTVYLGEDPFNDRPVALKRIHAHLLRDERDALRWRRALRNEASLAGRLRHPHIVAVHDADGEADPPYVVLEYVPGTSLAHYTRADRLLPVEHVLDICYKCCSALEYAHGFGLVHRDIKPANLMLQSDGNVKVADFGMATRVSADSTVTIGVRGSPMYMAPEQVREERCTHQSDMFSLAVVAYELLTGQRPFVGETDYATLYNIGTREPVLPSKLRPGLPPDIDAVLMLALAKRPEHRYAEWMDFAEALLAVGASVPRQRDTLREGEAFAHMRRLPFFAAFPDSVLWEALRLGKLVAHPAGSMLLKEGAKAETFCVLLEGRISVMRQGWEVARAQTGVTLGEMSYLRADAARRTATAIADTPVVVLEIANQALHGASGELRRCFDRAFIDLLLDRLEATTEKLGLEH